MVMAMVINGMGNSNVDNDVQSSRCKKKTMTPLLTLLPLPLSLITPAITITINGNGNGDGNVELFSRCSFPKTLMVPNPHSHPHMRHCGYIQLRPIDNPKHTNLAIQTIYNLQYQVCIYSHVHT